MSLALGRRCEQELQRRSVRSAGRDRAGRMSYVGTVRSIVWSKRHGAGHRVPRARGSDRRRARTHTRGRAC